MAKPDLKVGDLCQFEAFALHEQGAGHPFPYENLGIQTAKIVGETLWEGFAGWWLVIPGKPNKRYNVGKEEVFPIQG